MKTIRTLLALLSITALTFSALPTAQALKINCRYFNAIVSLVLINQTVCNKLQDGSTARSLCHMVTLGGAGALLAGGTYKACNAYGPSAITHPVTEQTLDDDDNEAEVDIETEDA